MCDGGDDDDIAEIRDLRGGGGETNILSLRRNESSRFMYLY